MKNFLLIFLLPIFFFSSCEKNFSNEEKKSEISKNFLEEGKDFSEQDLELKNLNLSENFLASVSDIENNSNLENKCKSIKHKIFTFDKVGYGKCFLKSNEKITEKFGSFGVKIDFENGKFVNPVYYQCGFDYYSDGKVCKKIKVDCGDDLECLKSNIKKGVSVKYLEDVKVQVPFVFMRTGLIYKSKRIIKFSSKGFKNEFFKGFSDPGTCISVESKCNKCKRKNRDDKFTCTENVCENEEFRCGGDNGDALQDNGELKISFNENIGLKIVYDESYLNSFMNKMKKETLEKNPNNKKQLEVLDRELNQIKNNKEQRDYFFKNNYKKDDKKSDNQKYFCKFSSILKVYKYINKKQNELEKAQNGDFSNSAKEYGKLPYGAISCSGYGYELQDEIKNNGYNLLHNNFVERDGNFYFVTKIWGNNGEETFYIKINGINGNNAKQYGEYLYDGNAFYYLNFKKVVKIPYIADIKNISYKNDEYFFDKGKLLVMDNFYDKLFVVDFINKNDNNINFLTGCNGNFIINNDKKILFHNNGKRASCYDEMINSYKGYEIVNIINNKNTKIINGINITN